MKYLIGVLLPPLGLFLVGKWFQSLLSLVLMLTLIGWPIAAVWAVLVMMNHDADRRTDRLIKVLRRAG